MKQVAAVGLDIAVAGLLMRRISSTAGAKRRICPTKKENIGRSLGE
jgi:hypothetical protein